jgi:hypothetical protein
MTDTVQGGGKNAELITQLQALSMLTINETPLTKETTVDMMVKTIKTTDNVRAPNRSLQITTLSALGNVCVLRE